MKNIKSYILLTFTTMLLFGVAYPLLIAGIGKISPDAANGNPVRRDGKVVGYENIGQAFSKPEYFWGRPSAVGYDASSTGGSNLGPSNPAYLAELQNRVDTLLKYHPGKTAKDLPVDLITASGGGLDPHIGLQAALFQAERVATARNIPVAQVEQRIAEQTKGAWLGLFGPGERVNVLKLNLALD